MRVEVRCCCEPAKLLGWLTVDEKLFTLRAGARYSWLVIDRLAFLRPLGLLAPRQKTAEILTLEVAHWEVTTGHNGLAFKSDDTPIETLRKVRGFVEMEYTQEG